MSSYTYKLAPETGTSGGDIDATNFHLVIGNADGDVINVYDMPGGTLNGQYSATGLAASSNFGNSVDIDSNSTEIYVGAPNNGAGSVHQFTVAGLISEGTQYDPEYLSSYTAPVEYFDGASKTIDLGTDEITFEPDGSTKYGFSLTSTSISFPPISTAGHSAGPSTDNGSSTVSLNNNFTFYGTSYSTIYLNSNGNITFSAGDSTSAFTWASFHNQERIGCFAADLRPDLAGSITYGHETDTNTDDTMIITFTGVSDGTNTNNCQIKLYLDNAVPAQQGKIVFSYGSVNVNSYVGLSYGTVPSDVDENIINLDAGVSGNITYPVSFGTDISFDGTTLLCSATSYLSNGGVYVFTSGTVDTVLLPSDSSPGDSSNFGNAVAQNTNHIVVGAYGDNTFTGALYIYTKSGYTETKKTETDTASFGYAVDANDTYIAASATTYGTPPASAPGAVILYNATTLAQDSVIEGTAFGANVTFGSDIKLTSSSRLLVGVSGYDFSNGRVAIYTKNGSWQLTTTITPDVSDGISFGAKLAYNDDYDFVYSSGSFVRGVDATTYGYSSSSICFVKDTMVMTNNGSIAVQDLERGMRIKTLNGYKMLARLIVTTNKDNTDFVSFKKNSISKDVPNRDLTITCGHPIYYKGDYYNPEDFANNNNFPNVKYLKANKCKLYQLQFETHEVVYVNNFTATSLPPYTDYLEQHLPKDMYFNKKLFNENNIGKNYPPYTLHDIPLVNGKLKEY